MSSESIKPTTPNSAPPTNGTPDELRLEVEQLRETARRLEAEREVYRKALERELVKRIRPEDVIIPDPDDCLTFDQFEQELEAIVHQGGSGAAK